MVKLDLSPRMKIDAKGRLLIPQDIRERLNIKSGDIYTVEGFENGKLLLEPLKRP